eukprot:TRINITY_DN4016_c0_g2_i1.p1 TRINITY_DN4016_c0_g2~~TRINITY_DN4016_c0_g2_i1.p1  ORF type:complete len:613 (+),score=151.65 TRINITY_DN4016_c0_g2_i1:162-2000(+)
MDFIKFQETPQQQTNAALDGDLSHSQFYNASEQTQNQPYYPTNPKPDPSPSETHLQYSTGIQPPVVDPCIDPCMPVPYVPGAGYEGLGEAAACFHDAGAEQRSSVVDSDGYGAAAVPSNGMQQMVGTNPNPMVWNDQRIHPYTSGILMKSLKKTKVVQSAWCELCKVDCNSHEMLNTHKMGKKHKKNLKKLEESKNVVNVAAEHAATEVTKDPEPAATEVSKDPESTAAEVTKDPATVKEIPPGESAPGTKPEVDLETKKRKLVEVGTSADSLRVCIICNVVCNSETVFKFHLAGQKHAAKVASASDGMQPLVGPNPKSNPDPESELDTDQNPNSYPNPNPNSNSDPDPDPDPNSNSDPDPTPNPNSNPDSDPNPIPNPVTFNDQVCQATVNGAAKKKKKKIKKTEVVQPVWCELCSISCTGQEVLDRHKFGKRHKKNLEKLEELKNAAAVVKPDSLEAGTTENQPGEEAKTTERGAKRKKTASKSKTGEDLETKKQKLLECGITADLVKVCTICNVVCNSETVYSFHMSGQKHATQVRKQTTEMAKSAISPQFVSAAKVTLSAGPEPISDATVTITPVPELVSGATVTTTVEPEHISAATVVTTVGPEFHL